MFLRLLGSIFVLTITGCIAVPVNLFFDEPFKESVKSLAIGSEQQDVRKFLGDPHAIRLGGKVWFYGKARPLVWVIGDGSDGTIDDYNWLELVFNDNGELVSFEHMEGKSDCTSNGNCLLYGGWEKGVMTEVAVFAAPRENDNYAKQRSDENGMCALYVYFDSSSAAVDRFFLSDDILEIQINNMPEVFLNRDVYLFVEVAPGDVIIKGLGFDRVLGQTELSCETGTSHFLHIHRPKFFEPGRLSFAWESNDSSHGAISERRLLLAP